MAVAAVVCAPVAGAGEFAYGVDAGMGLSDNIAETATNRRSEYIADVGAQFSGLEQSSRLQAQMVGDLEYLDYLRGTYSPQAIGNFAGMAAFALIPEHLQWMLQDNFGQGLIDPAIPGTPNNREYINSVTTGPTVNFAFGPQTLLSLIGRYSRVSYQTSPLSNDQFGGGISLARLLSQRSRISLNVQSNRFDFTNSINPDYDEREAFVSYEATGARTRLKIDAGYDQLRGTQLDTSGFLGRLSVSRTMALQSQLTLTAGHEYSSSSAFLTQTQGVNGVSLDTTPGRQTSTPFTNEYETVDWSFVRPRTTFDLLVTHYKQVYPDQSLLNQTLTGAAAHLSRTLFPTWIVSLHVDYEKQALEQQTGNYRQLHGGASVKWRMGRKLSLDLQYDRYSRNGDLALYDFAENRVWLRLQYGDGTPQTHLAPSDLTPAGAAANPRQTQMRTN